MKISVLLFFLIFILTSTFGQEKRIALVIGNAAYQYSGALKNPVNDAKLMATTLQSLGFTVIKKNNIGLKAMQLALDDFSSKMKDYDVALFFYAGHGIQIDGDNFLIPVDAKLEQKGIVQYEAFNVDYVSKAINESNVKLSIVILDACRNNPFKTWMRGYSRGFTPVDNQAAGSIIAYATREDEAASDGIGKFGLYTENLVKQMLKPQNISEVFQNTRIEVLKASGNEQCPQEWNMLTRNFYFNNSSKQGENNANNQIENNLLPDTIIQSLGSVKIDSEIEGSLYIDDFYIGKIAAGSKGNILNNQRTGNHKIRIEGNETWMSNISIDSGQVTKLYIKSNFLPGIVDKPGYFTDTRDSSVYQTKKIGSQLWMAENLHFDAGPGCFYYDDNQYNRKEYGSLYSYKAATNGCPAGWHLPSKSDIDSLIKYSGGSDTLLYKAIIKGGKSDLNFNFGGWRNFSDTYSDKDYFGYYWTSYEPDDNGPRFLFINQIGKIAYLAKENKYKFLKIFYEVNNWALSVRCVRDN